MKTLRRYALVPALIVALGATSSALAQEQDTFEFELTDTDRLAIGAALLANETVGFVESVDDINGDVDIIAGDDGGTPAISQVDDDDPSSSVRVFATIDKDKDKRVLELVAKLKLAVIFVANILRPEGAAQSEVVVEQENQNNVVNHDFGTEPNNDPNNPNAPYPMRLFADIIDSFNDNTGIIQGNQDVGNMVNQANVASVAVTTSATAFSDAQATASQHNNDNISTTVVFIDPDAIANPPTAPGHELTLTKRANLENSVTSNSGVVHVNQNAGDMNNQLNGTSLGVAIDAIVALSETDLGQFNSGNDVTDTNTVKADIITGSVTSNTGIVNVNQSAGAMNNQATMVSFSGIATIGAPLLPFQP